MSTAEQSSKGPLSGLKVLEVGGIGPAPFCCMLLADLGADVIRVDRKNPSESGFPVDRSFEFVFRSRRSIALDIKKPEGIEILKKMIADSDVLVEGFRPGVMERLGLGPDICFDINPKLVYGRMTGWGQSGPMAKEAGHDINYIALTGALHAIGQKDGPPQIPLNLIGDFGGGALYLAFGIMCALHESKLSGRGQVVDAAMVDGSTSLMTMIYGLLASGYWTDERGSNRLDSGAPWYNVYETKDNRYVAVGATEASFYKATVEVLGLNLADLPDQHDKSGWPNMKVAFANAFKMRTRDEWCQAFEGKDCCFSPVLSMAEAPSHPHQRARGNFVNSGGLLQPSPAPKFSRSQAQVSAAPPKVGEHTHILLTEAGFKPDDIERFKGAHAI